MSMMATSSKEKEHAREIGPRAASMPARRISTGVASDGNSKIMLLMIIPLKAKPFSRGVAEKVKTKYFASTPKTLILTLGFLRVLD
jgi:hypothetical protein